MLFATFSVTLSNLSFTGNAEKFQGGKSRRNDQVTSEFSARKHLVSILTPYKAILHKDAPFPWQRHSRVP